MSLPCLLLFHRHRLPHLTRQPEPPRRWYCSVPRGSGGTVAVRFLDPPPHKMLLRQETQNVTLEGEIGTLFAFPVPAT